MTHEEIRAGIARWLSVFFVSITFSIAGTAFAQDADDETDVDDLEDPGYEEITVTGSRIKRDEFNSSAPIAVITTDRSQLAGLLDSSDILQGSTIASGQQINDSFSGFVPAGGPGANTLSLRGLGAQRTLVLVNGKRWGPSGLRGSTSSVDLTAIPTSLINRFEILKDGASSVYGADAVAGVVNAITKERVDGFQLNMQSQVPEASGGEAYSIDGTFGKVGDNWSFNVGVAYGKQEELLAIDRKWAECPIRPRFTDQDGGGNIDNIDPATGEQLCFGFLYGTIFNAGLRYEPNLDIDDPNDPFFDPFWNGQLRIPFYTEAGTGPLDNQTSSFYRDERNPTQQNIINEGEILSVTSFADYDFSIMDRSATVYYEFYWNRRESTLDGGYRQFFPVVPASNPNNPIGNFSTPEFLNFFGGGFGAQIVLPSYELQATENRAEIDRYNAFVGLKGDISSTWSYDAYFGYSDSDGTYSDEAWLLDRVNASIDGIDDGNGNVVCRDTANFPGCVSPDFFSTAAMLDGDLPAWRDFVSKRTVGSTTFESRQFNGYATGDLFEMPAGTAAAVIGFEWRREEINDVPDIDAQNDNIWGSSTSQITAGADTVREFFGELEVPLFANAVLAEQLTLNLSGRYTDYNSYGDDTTHRVALDWQFNENIRFRGTRGTSFRAPDLYEQFLGNETGFLQIIDPCANYGDNFGPGDSIFQNCASEGLAPDFAGTGSSIRTVTGGSEELEAETSDSWTLGFILTPGDTGISLAMNWFDIEIKDTVASPTENFILNDCYESTGFSSPFCSRISPRDSLGNLTDIDSSLLNIGLQRSKGLDIDVLYQREFSSFDLIVDLTATYIEKQDQELLGQFDEFRGKWGYPDWSAGGDFIVDYRDWRFQWTVNWIGNQSEDPVFDPGTMNLDRPVKTGTATYNTLGVRYTADSWQVVGTIRNMFDEDPPIVGDNVGSQTANRIFNTLPGVGYELLGRSYILQASLFFGGN